MAAGLSGLVAKTATSGPRRVLGLTFTEAAAEACRAGQDAARRLRRGGRLLLGGQPGRTGWPVRPGQTAPGRDWRGRGLIWPVIPSSATYHSYAGGLIADHALREALEPTNSPDHPGRGLAAGGQDLAAYDGPMDAVDWAPVTVNGRRRRVVRELAEHCGDPATCSSWRLAAAAPREVPGRQAPAGRSDDPNASASASSYSPCVRAMPPPRLSARASIRRSDGARGAHRHRPSGGRGCRARQVQIVLLDEFQDTSHAPA